MIEENTSPGLITTHLFQSLNEISLIALQAKEIDPSLEEIMRFVRTIFIFDNVVLYLQQGDNLLEPAYARAVGRGRSSEMDLAWGEAVAQDSLRENKIITRKEIDGDYTVNRMRLRYFIGLPLTTSEEQIGSLVFVRYGGPPYQSDQMQLAKHIARNVTQLLARLNLYKKIINLENELRSKRLQDDFIATISHELLTPLGFIKGYATTLLRDDTTWDDETRSEFLNIIDEETDRLRELIDNLLDSSRLQSGTLRMEFQPLRLDTLLKDVCLRARSFNENQDIELIIENSGVQVQADPRRIAQVIENLLNNAQKYAPGSKVVITLIKFEENNAHIILQDFGPGIAPDHLEHIFDRFYRVPINVSSIRGTGLGLFICRRIMKAHNGEINVESTLGEGSIFHIFLPIKQSNNNLVGNIHQLDGGE